MCFGGGADDPGRERRHLSGNAYLLEDERNRTRGMLTGQEDNQKAFAQQLADRALGKGPSAVDMQMRAAQDRTLAQQLALAKSTRAGNPLLNQRAAQMNAARAGQEIAQAGAAARIQEQAQNQNQYQSYLQGQQQNFNNLSALTTQALTGSGQIQQSQQAHDDSLAGGLIGTAGQVGAAFLMSDKNQKKKIKKETKFSDKKKDSYESPKSVSDEDEKIDITDESKKNAKDKYKDDFKKGLLTNHFNSGENNPFKGIGDLGAAFVMSQANKPIGVPMAPMMGASPKFGSVPMMPSVSDKKEKKGVSKAKTDIDRVEENEKKEDMSPEHFLDKIQPYSYEYKNPEKPGAGKGRYLGVMAQDLEKAGPVGKSMVETQKDGSKMVDFGKGFGAILAAQAHLHQRLKDIEGKKGKKE